MNLDKEGRYRINLYLNVENKKDKAIIDYLENLYSSSDFLKDTLYQIATGKAPIINLTRKAAAALKNELNALEKKQIIHNDIKIYNSNIYNLK